MGMSKHDLERRKQNLKRDIEALEKICKMDPLKKKPQNHEELEQLKKKLAEY